MPIYEYRCKKCGRIFEAMHAWSDPSPVKCEYCGAHGKGVLTRLISTTQVVFKGSGFYLTDNRGAKNSTFDSSPGDVKSDGKSDSKADGKGGGKDSAALSEPAPVTKSAKKNDK